MACSRRLEARRSGWGILTPIPSCPDQDDSSLACGTNPSNDPYSSPHILPPSPFVLGIVDYGGGNIQSVRNALVACDAKFIELSGPERLTEVSALIFPGQGAFGDSMQALHSRGLVDPLREWLRADRPFFGICIGYQVLFESSEEEPGVAGLGVFAGQAVKFPAQPGLKIPHMGWNTAHIEHPQDPLWQGLGVDPFFYFVHSYYPQPVDEALVATRTTYGPVSFASSIKRGNVQATQFHPEKSQANGLRLLANFVSLYK